MKGQYYYSDKLGLSERLNVYKLQTNVTIYSGKRFKILYSQSLELSNAVEVQWGFTVRLKIAENGNILPLHRMKLPLALPVT